MIKNIYTEVEGVNSIEKAITILNCNNVYTLRQLAQEHNESIIVSRKISLEASKSAEDNLKLVDNSIKNKPAISKTFSLLHLAADKGDYEVVKYLINKGYNPNLRASGTLFPWAAYEVAPLHLATAKGHTNVVKQLIKANAEINIECYLSLNGVKPGNTQKNSIFCMGLTPILLAAKYGQMECIDILNFYGAKLDCKYKVFSEKQILATPTIFHAAALQGHYECIDLLKDLYRKEFNLKA